MKIFRGCSMGYQTHRAASKGQEMKTFDTREIPRKSGESSGMSQEKEKSSLFRITYIVTSWMRVASGTL